MKHGSLLYIFEEGYMKLNSDGELVENTMILDDGTVVFIDEHRMSRKEQAELDNALGFLSGVDDKYGTLDIFELMDKNMLKGEMFKYLCAMRVAKKHGLIGGVQHD